MIIEIMYLMLTLAFLFLILGYWIKVPYVALMGWIMLFLMFMGLTFGSVDYKIGQTEILQSDNVTTVTTYDYTSYTDSKIFLYLTIISGLGFTSVFFTKDFW